ncbi:MAG: iron-sulfur cluster assembly scaffold protein [Christensenellales bacterium]
MYNENVLKIFENPTHSGMLKGANGIGICKSEDGSEIFKIYIKVENDMVVDAKFKTFGCVGAIVSSEVACTLIKGQNLDYVSNLPQEEILNSLGQLPQGKEECATMAIKTIKEAVKNYRKKQLQLAIKMQRDLEKSNITEDQNI